MNRRLFLRTSAQAGALGLAGFAGLGTAGCAGGNGAKASGNRAATSKLAEPTREERELVTEGFRVALDKYLYPALLDRIYPGHFIIAPDGGFGTENTWPGLDSWQMAGAYLLLGRLRVVLDYFDFVAASQRKDGNIPFAIFPGEQSPGSLESWLRGLRFPEDVYSYQPSVRPGQQKHSDIRTRKWIGLFTHWQIKANPLSVLGAVSYILT